MSNYEIRKLSHLFFMKYNPLVFVELEHKENRGYDIVLFETSYDYFICIPFRSNINHNNAYHFKNSIRSQNSKSGLDYSKIVIINDPSLIGSQAMVDKDEANELYHRKDYIHSKVLDYVENYRKHILKTCELHPREFQRNYRFTTLKYFHSELNLPD